MQPSFNPARDGRSRVVIENVTPEIDGGLFPVKRTRGESVTVEADMFADGHEVISCMLLFRREEEKNWREAPMKLLVNDRWRGMFVAAEIGRYVYTLAAWVDQFQVLATRFAEESRGRRAHGIGFADRRSVDRRSGKASCRRRCKKTRRRTQKALRAKDQTLSDKLATALER